jgi:hypothetical protein
MGSSETHGWNPVSQCALAPFQFPVLMLVNRIQRFPLRVGGLYLNVIATFMQKIAANNLFLLYGEFSVDMRHDSGWRQNTATI